jgi:hypothetical protein
MSDSAVDLVEATRRLTDQWVEVLKPEENPWGRFVPMDRGPLLGLLEQRIGSSVGRGSGGSSSLQRIPIDAAALELWQSIDERTQASVAFTGHMPVGETLLARVADFVDHLVAAHNTGGLSERDWAHLSTLPARWCEAIMDMFDGWRTKELTAPCPLCHQLWVSDPREKETRHHCMQLHFRDGGPEAWAECRRCSHEWHGVRELRELGFSIGAQADRDALEEMGVA